MTQPEQNGDCPPILWICWTGWLLIVMQTSRKLKTCLWETNPGSDMYWWVLMCIPFSWCLEVGWKENRWWNINCLCSLFSFCDAFILMNLWLEMPLGSVWAKLKIKLNSWSIALWILERALLWHSERCLCESLCLKVRDTDCEITFLDRFWHAFSPRIFQQKTTRCKTVYKAKKSLTQKTSAKMKWVIGKNRVLSNKSGLYRF